MRKFFTTIFLSLFVFSTLTGVAVSQIDKETIKDLYAQVELFSYALTTIQSEYVEEKSPQDLIYGSLKGMLSSLDAHSQFLSPEEYEDLKTETQGEFGGLGIEISIRDGLLTVITPIEDTPAWEAGLQAQDRIVKIEDEITKDMTLSDAVKLLRGKPGTDVTITVLREEDFKIMDFTITREVISIQDVKNTQILTDKVGYIRLTEFREHSAEEFHKALAKLKELGADSMILDLRNNPGGLLNVAIDITEEFLPEGSLIVSTKGRRASQTSETYSRTTENKILKWPVAILINAGSASGSEILAGALKDNNRGVIVGTKSFGKGSVQSVIPLPDGSGLRLTTSKYYTPSGVSIHKTGIIPDIVVKPIDRELEEKDETAQNLENIFRQVESEDEDQQKKEDMTEKEREVHDRLMSDNQVQAAINVLKGIKVYKAQNGDSAETAEEKKKKEAAETAG
ncbi:MAG: S41 family peptidase [Candidatus Omnitrophota bacterium]